MTAPLEEAGRLLVYYTGGTPSPAVLWSSPANYNSPTGTTQTIQFTTPHGYDQFLPGLRSAAGQRLAGLRQHHPAPTRPAGGHHHLQDLQPGRPDYRFAGDGRASPGLYYVYTDHLGSTSRLSNSSGSPVSGSDARFLPFGKYRTTPTAGLTDRGFTGHLQNDYIKLVDMQARWYDAEIGRFISPDTIVPDPTNPQTFNRHAYSYNNPLRYTDPSGHCGADMNFPSSGGAEYRNEIAYQQCVELRDGLAGLYGISITGIWKLAEMQLLEKGLQAVLDSFTQAGVEDSLGAFQDTFKNTEFQRVRELHGNTTAFTFALSKKIEIYDGAFRLPDDKGVFHARSEQSVAGTVAHELGHIWDWHSGGALSQGLSYYAGGGGQLCIFGGVMCLGTYQADEPFVSTYAATNKYEDWAETFRVFVVDLSELQRVSKTRADYVLKEVSWLGD